MSFPVRVSVWTGAKQKLPTWLGPPCSSSKIFQSVHPQAPSLRSLIIEYPYRSPSDQFCRLSKANFSLQPSVKSKCVEGKAACTNATLPNCMGKPVQVSYQ